MRKKTSKLISEKPAKTDAVRLRVVGLGQFASGAPDLGSNKRYLVDFGR